MQLHNSPLLLLASFEEEVLVIYLLQLNKLVHTWLLFRVHFIYENFSYILLLSYYMIISYSNIIC